jgi:hypothetical protein
LRSVEEDTRNWTYERGRNSRSQKSTQREESFITCTLHLTVIIVGMIQRETQREGEETATSLRNANKSKNFRRAH